MIVDKEICKLYGTEKQLSFALIVCWSNKKIYIYSIY